MTLSLERRLVECHPGLALLAPHTEQISMQSVPDTIRLGYILTVGGSAFLKSAGEVWQHLAHRSGYRVWGASPIPSHGHRQFHAHARFAQEVAKTAGFELCGWWLADRMWKWMGDGGGDGDHGWRRKRIVVFPAEKCCSATAKYIYAPMRRSLPSLSLWWGLHRSLL